VYAVSAAASATSIVATDRTRNGFSFRQPKKADAAKVAAVARSTGVWIAPSALTEPTMPRAKSPRDRRASMAL
jgi:hypothetical protein